MSKSATGSLLQQSPRPSLALRDATGAYRWGIFPVIATKSQSVDAAAANIKHMSVQCVKKASHHRTCPRHYGMRWNFLPYLASGATIQRQMKLPTTLQCQSDRLYHGQSIRDTLFLINSSVQTVKNQASLSGTLTVLPGPPLSIIFPQLSL